MLMNEFGLPQKESGLPFSFVFIMQLCLFFSFCHFAPTSISKRQENCLPKVPIFASCYRFQKKTLMNEFRLPQKEYGLTKQLPFTPHFIPKGQENWLPKVPIFASYRKFSKKNTLMYEFGLPQKECGSAFFFVLIMQLHLFLYLLSFHLHHLTYPKGKIIGHHRC